MIMFILTNITKMISCVFQHLTEASSLSMDSPILSENRCGYTLIQISPHKLFLSLAFRKLV